jgi:spermidine/putrescine-binding protein
VTKRNAAQDLVRGLKEGTVGRRDFVSRAAALGLGWSTIGSILMACTGGRGDDAPPADSTGAAMADLGPVENQLSIFNWSDYIAAETVPNFEKEFGIRVSYATYESNEELVA